MNICLSRNSNNKSILHEVQPAKYKDPNHRARWRRKNMSTHIQNEQSDNIRRERNGSKLTMHSIDNSYSNPAFNIYNYIPIFKDYNISAFNVYKNNNLKSRPM